MRRRLAMAAKVEDEGGDDGWKEEGGGLRAHQYQGTMRSALVQLMATKKFYGSMVTMAVTKEESGGGGGATTNGMLRHFMQACPLVVAL